MSPCILVLSYFVGFGMGADPLPPSLTGRLYVSGWGSNSIGEYSPAGVLLRVITAPNLVQPRGIAADDDGNLVVVCEGSQRILVLSLDGSVLRSVQHPQLVGGTAVARGSNGNWYVANYTPGRILVFDEQWNFLSTITRPGLDGIGGLAFSAGGDFVVTSAFSNEVYGFTAQHGFIGSLTHPEFAAPSSVVFNRAGECFVASSQSDRVVVFSPTFVPQGSFGQGTLSGPQGLAVDERDELTVTNFFTSTVHRYASNGQLVGTWPLSGVVTARGVAWQTSPRILARRGGVATAAGTSPTPVLQVSGQPADALERVTLQRFQPFSITLGASPVGPSGSSVLLWGLYGEPGLSDVLWLPFGAGLFSFSDQSGAVPPVLLVDSTGLAGITPALLPPAWAPGTIIDFPNGVGVPGTVTLQGLILDDGSQGAPAVPVSPTNALILTVL